MFFLTLFVSTYLYSYIGIKNIVQIKIPVSHWLGLIQDWPHIRPALGPWNYVSILKDIRKEGNVLFNDTPSTFYIWLYGFRHMIKDHSTREKTHCYSFWLAVRVLLYATSHRQDKTYHSLCYTIRGALARTINSSMGPPWRINLTMIS